MPTRSGDPHGHSGPDADFIAALDNTVGRAVLAALRSGPRTAAELSATTGHDDAAVWTALRALTAQGLVTADHPRLPGDVAYRIDSAALTGFRGLGRWFRSRSSAAGDTHPSSADRPQPVADEVVPAGGSDGDDHPSTGTSDGFRARPSVAAWTNPAVKAALQRLEEQQRRPR